MKLSDFQFDLPDELIAQRPPEQRGDSRLLYLDGTSGEIQDMQFGNLPGLLRPDDLLIMNDTRVIPARLFGKKQSGGKLEILIERQLGEGRFLAQVKASKAPKPGTVINLDNNHNINVIERQEDFYLLAAENESTLIQIISDYGHVPLPPYIERDDNEIDLDRYQTIYAEKDGAVAAPTAGLHFTDNLLGEIQRLGIQTAFITLHVGAGTFQPVRVESIEDHRMHRERYIISDKVCQQINETRQKGGRIIAVGTTCVRTLETLALMDEMTAHEGDTPIFIYPGFEFQLVDAMITNFHLSGSTLLMLVSAFAGRTHIMNAYKYAMDEKYRFFSYGDAMFILKNVGREE